MLRQIHIIDTKVADLIFQEVYLVNVLVNSQGFEYIFYKTDLFLEHQNRKFKKFQSNCRLSLQESDEIFWLYVLLIDALRKVRLSLNKTIVGKYCSRYHPTKNALFNILSLANQLY